MMMIFFLLFLSVLCLFAFAHTHIYKLIIGYFINNKQQTTNNKANLKNSLVEIVNRELELSLHIEHRGGER
jgi:hypothetical protein